MSSTLARPHRFILTVGLALGLAASLPLAAGAADRPATAAVRPAVTAAATVRNHPPAWTAAIVHATAARYRSASELTAPKAPSAAVTVRATSVHRATSSKPAVAATTRVGTNHFWFPSLGISHVVATFSCTRSTPPGAGVYRWGCAGKDNAYLFGHAWSTMQPLHDAYVAGRLRTGMIAYYADGAGHVRRYEVTQIKVVTPDQVGWAIAAQSVPSMTLQTCVGSRSQYRLLVRLVAA